MDMKNYLEKLRAKPEHVRIRIAFLTSSFMFILIFTGWSFTKHAPDLTKSPALADATSPLSVVANAFSGLKTQTQYVATSLQKNLEDAQIRLATNTPEREIRSSTSFESIMSSTSSPDSILETTLNGKTLINSEMNSTTSTSAPNLSE